MATNRRASSLREAVPTDGIYELVKIDCELQNVVSELQKVVVQVVNLRGRLIDGTYRFKPEEASDAIFLLRSINKNYKLLLGKPAIQTDAGVENL